MNAPRQSEVGALSGENPARGEDGEQVRHGRRRLAAEYDDGLYRYVPVPPVYRDAEGYPLEDGMWQEENHQKETAYWCNVLQCHFPQATVCSDLPMPYQRGDGNRTVVPDLLVALRAPALGNRSSYKLWENPLPDVAMEMLMPRTWQEDVGPKRRTYEHVGVREYWLFDLGGRHLSAELLGYRLDGKRYRRIAANATGRFPSEVLGLELHVRDGRLRFRNPVGKGSADLRGRSGRPSRGRAEGRRGRTSCRCRAHCSRSSRTTRGCRTRAGPPAGAEGLGRTSRRGSRLAFICKRTWLRPAG